MKKALTLILAILLALTPVVSSALYGDFDGDGAVKSNDLITLARHIAEFEGYATIDTGLADVNGDGEVSVVDGLILKRHWAGWSSYQTLPFTGATEEEKFDDFINVRSDLSNIYNKIQNNGTINVVYYGGSVTVGFGAGLEYGVSGGTGTNETTSWRALTFNWLENTFPDATFNQYAASCGGTGSHLGAFRLEGDVIARNPDIVFIEFVINDYYSGTVGDGMVTLYFESIVRRIREAHPECEIFPVYVTDRGLSNSLYTTPTVLSAGAAAQEIVAERYGLTSFNVGGYVTDCINNEDGGYISTNWYKYFYDTAHPEDGGYKAYADLIIKYLNAYLTDGTITAGYGTEIEEYATPVGYVDSRIRTFDPQLVLLNKYSVLESFKNIEINSTSVYTGSTMKGYMYPTSADNEIVFKFTGTGVDLVMGNNEIEYSIDGGETKTYAKVDGNAPKRFIDGLEPGEHTLKIKFIGQIVEGVTDPSTVTGTSLRAFLVEGIK